MSDPTSVDPGDDKIKAKHSEDAEQSELRGEIEIRMEIDYDEFLPKRAQYILNLASALEIPPDDIWITGLRRGCVVLRLNMRKTPRQKLDTVFKKQASSPAVETWLKEGQVDQVDLIRRDVHFPNVQPRSGGQSAINSRRPNRSFTWLHLSDLHLRADGGTKGEESKFFEQKIVTSSLLRDLPRLLSKQALEPDLVFFTGDVTLSGSRKEYTAALSFFTEMRNCLPRPVPFFFIPGNHDTYWESIDEVFDKSARKKLDSSFTVAQHLMDDDQANWRETAGKRLANYMRFSKAAQSIGQPKMNGGYEGQEIFYLTVKKNFGLKIAVAGLNSAWMCTKKSGKKRADIDADKGELIVGEPQVFNSLEKMETADLRIALIHHPPASDWFKPFDRDMQEAKFHGYDFVLRGHEHTPGYLETVSAGKPWRQIAAGALYTQPDIFTGFNAVRIDLDSHMIGSWLWRFYAGKKYSWDVDANNAEHAGEIEIRLPDKLRDRLSNAKNRSSR